MISARILSFEYGLTSKLFGFRFKIKPSFGFQLSLKAKLGKDFREAAFLNPFFVTSAPATHHSIQVSGYRVSVARWLAQGSGLCV